MYKLFIANKNYSSWSLRPWAIMHALELTFEEQVIPFGADSNWDAFRQFAPAGKVPCLHDGDQVIWDSLGIIEYLAEKHQGVWPRTTAERAWARCAAAEMHSGFTHLRQTCPMHVGFRIKLKHISPELQRDLDRLNELWCEGLNKFGGPYLAGDKFTAVDAFFAPVIFRIQTYGLALSEMAQAYVNRQLRHPVLHRWEKQALNENWREKSHEEAALAAGELLIDHRRN